MTYIVEPLFIEWDRFAPSPRSRVMLKNLRRNRTRWEAVLQQEKEPKAATSTTITVDVIRAGSGTWFTNSRRSSRVDSEIDRCGREDKENKMPATTVEMEVVLDYYGMPVNGPRRHSLPTDSTPTVRSSEAAVEVSRSRRRHSVPTVIGALRVVSTADRLASLAESSPIGNEHFDFDASTATTASKVRRRAANEDSPGSTAMQCIQKTFKTVDVVASDRRGSGSVKSVLLARIHAVETWRPESYGEVCRRFSLTTEPPSQSMQQHCVAGRARAVSLISNSLCMPPNPAIPSHSCRDETRGVHRVISPKSTNSSWLRSDKDTAVTVHRNNFIVAPRVGKPVLTATSSVKQKCSGKLAHWWSSAVCFTFGFAGLSLGYAIGLREEFSGCSVAVAA